MRIGFLGSLFFLVSVFLFMFQVSLRSFVANSWLRDDKSVVNYVRKMINNDWDRGLSVVRREWPINNSQISPLFSLDCARHVVPCLTDFLNFPYSFNLRIRFFIGSGPKNLHWQRQRFDPASCQSVPFFLFLMCLQVRYRRATKAHDASPFLCRWIATIFDLKTPKTLAHHIPPEIHITGSLAPN